MVFVHAFFDVPILFPAHSTRRSRTLLDPKRARDNLQKPETLPTLFSSFSLFSHPSSTKYLGGIVALNSHKYYAVLNLSLLILSLIAFFSGILLWISQTRLLSLICLVIGVLLLSASTSYAKLSLAKTNWRKK